MSDEVKNETKTMSSAVAHALPPSILALFSPRVPLDHKTPPNKRKCLGYTGISQLISEFEDPDRTPAKPELESVAQHRMRVATLKLEAASSNVERAAEGYDPSSDDKVKDLGSDPYKTLFVARLSYETTTNTLKKAFEQFGTVKSCTVVHDSVTNTPRGYAFIEFDHERDMKTAYKQGDGKKIDGRRVLVDVERGRTVRNWRPRRLGGGLGSSRAYKPRAAGVTAPRPAIGGGGYNGGSGGGGGGSGGGGGGCSGPSRGSSGPAPSFTWSTESRSEVVRSDRDQRDGRDRDRRDDRRDSRDYDRRGDHEFDQDRRDDRERRRDRERERDHRDRDRPRRSRSR